MTKLKCAAVLMLGLLKGRRRLPAQKAAYLAPCWLVFMFSLCLLSPHPAHAQRKKPAPANQQVIAKVDELLGKADTLTAEARYNEAETLYQQAAAMVEREIGAAHPHLGLALNGLGLLYLATGNYAAAEPLFQRALEIWQKSLGLKHPLVAAALNNLGELSRATGKLAQAESFYQRALTITEKNFGPQHPAIATIFNNIALVYLAQGKYPAAELYLKRTLAIEEKAYGSNSAEIALTLNNLGELYNATGKYAEAEPIFQRALKIMEQAYGPVHPLVATVLHNLARSYIATGNYLAAEPLLNRDLAITGKVLGPEHPDLATTLSGLANLYQLTGRVMQTEPLYKRALVIYEKALGPEHPSVIDTLNSLAELYRVMGNYTVAETFFKRTLEIQEKVYGQPNPSTLTGLGALYLISGDYGQAEPLLNRSLKLMEEAGLAEHHNITLTLMNLAALYDAQGDANRSLACYARAIGISEKNIAAYLATGSEQRKQFYLNRLNYEPDFLISLHLRDLPQDAAASRLALTTILQRKGRSLDAFSNQLNALRSRANPADLKLLDQLADTRRQIANLTLSNDNRLAPEARKARLAELQAQNEALESNISRRSAEFRAVTQPATLERVQAALPPNSALIEFFIYHPSNPKAKNDAEYFGPPRYVAYVLQPNGAISFADLGPAAEIDADAARFHAAVQSPKTPEAEVKQLARKLDERVMRPVRKLLGDTRRVFLSPDGALNLVPFAAFVDENGKYLAETYSLTYLTSGRDLLRLQVSGQSQEAPTVLANPLFDATKSANPAATLAALNRQLGLGGAQTVYRDLDFTQFVYSPLPGTAQEAQALAAVVPGARLWLDAAATEKALKSVARPRLLHIATHGFFLPDQPPAAPAVTRQVGFGTEAARPAGPLPENPLLRSGLILAGVKQRASGAGEDGVLTAQEAAGLNLFGTKLVVLSACETGLGEVQNGAGVYGLRRALVLAGSEAQVMSLWKVADTATAALMTAYYTRLQRGEGRSEAMRQVQLELLKNGKLAQPVGETRKIEQEGEKGKAGPADWRHPYYWASFIQSGAWTNLDGK